MWFDDKCCESVTVMILEHELERPPFNGFIIRVGLATLLHFLEPFMRTPFSVFMKGAKSTCLLRVTTCTSELDEIRAVSRVVVHHARGELKC